MKFEDFRAHTDDLDFKLHTEAQAGLMIEMQESLDKEDFIDIWFRKGGRAEKFSEVMTQYKAEEPSIVKDWSNPDNQQKILGEIKRRMGLDQPRNHREMDNLNEDAA